MFTAPNMPTTNQVKSNKFLTSEPTTTSIPQQMKQSGVVVDMKNINRNLKVQYNLVQDENLRLKTRLQTMALELQKNEKDMESMLRSLQVMDTNGLRAGQYQESLLVVQLKKQNRQLKHEISQKDTEIENLKRNVKLSKNKENEQEL